MFDKEAVRSASPLADVIPALLGVSLSTNGTRELAIRCPFHDDEHPSMRVNLMKEVWRCDPCDAGGDVFDLVQRVSQVSFPEALRWLAERAGVAEAPVAVQRPQRRQVAAYDYRRADGTLMYQTIRYEPKDPAKPIGGDTVAARHFHRERGGRIRARRLAPRRPPRSPA
jgi:DNA primase